MAIWKVNPARSPHDAVQGRTDNESRASQSKFQWFILLRQRAGDSGLESVHPTEYIRVNELAQITNQYIIGDIPGSKIHNLMCI
jgi:hypothetical protein